MCFMFGASREQVRHALGLADEAERDEPDEENSPVYALHSSNVCAELPP
ncbi:hypothetical protein [Nocardia sp. NRRL S-836]|nr:hypothetical protein [Nocardia sp. NRRL S-836]